jgi:endonuclease G
MKIPLQVENETLRRADKLPAGTLERRELDFAPHRERKLAPHAMGNRAAFLPLGGAQPSKAELERLLGTNDLVDEFYLERALLAAQPVCRLSIRAPSGHERGCATGFMVSPRLLLTNHHVFRSEDEAAPSIAEFNYRLDVAGRPEASYPFRLRPDLFFFSHAPLDFALVAVDARSMDGSAELATFGYHRLIPDSGKAQLKEWMTIIQHPGGARRQFAIRENQCVDDRDRDVIWYMSDTAQGSSGSPVLNDSFQVVALHHSGVPRKNEEGRYLLKNGKTVADLQDADDADVDWIANAGIRVSRICAHVLEAVGVENPYVAELREAMAGTGDVLSSAFQNPTSSPGEAVTRRIHPTQLNPGGSTRLVLGSLVLELNGALLGQPATPAAAAVVPAPIPIPAAGGGTPVEALKEPIIDTDYTSRRGFDTNFLGIPTPLPEVSDEAVVAPMLDGRKVIPYEHFSVVLHRERRLAIYTASNVDGRAAAKRPEPGRDYSRDGLTGLGKNDQEKWVVDPRVDAQFQIPDRFYTKDNGAFDKGHIVRREDVCFGASYDQVRRANGDTFHVTNCSPQRGNFNRSNLGGIWGNLENFIGAQADKEQYCLFAGPVLSPADKTFVGTERVKLPTRFWKVVCAVKDGRLQVFAFVLEQDVSDLPLEFQLTAEWKSKQVALKALEEMVGLVKFPPVYHEADQATPPSAPGKTPH